MNKFLNCPRIAFLNYGCTKKSKVSRARRGARRAHNALKKEPLSLDPVTGEKHLRHHMTKDGFFKGRKILDIKTKDDSTEDSP